MKKVLILGGSGMLGNVVYRHFKNNTTFKTDKTERTFQENALIFDVNNFIRNPSDFAFLKNYDYIINAIGVIKPYCKDSDQAGVQNAILVNAYFPHVLSTFLSDSKTRIIQIATDCVYSGTTGSYAESDPHDPLDVYGKTKSLGEVTANNILHIRCSIIGPEVANNISLLEWFLSQKNGEELIGFEHHKWNGVTTLQFASLCEHIIEHNAFESIRTLNHIHHFVPNTAVTKFELLTTFKEIFNKQVTIHKKNDPHAVVDRTLSTKFNVLQKYSTQSTIKQALIELQAYMK